MHFIHNEITDDKLGAVSPQFLERVESVTRFRDPSYSHFGEHVSHYRSSGQDVIDYHHLWFLVK
jgi:hypothetical protein